MENKKKLAEIIRRLKKEFPELRTALNFRSPFELLTATILSAQTTDAQVNKVTGPLFKKYKSLRDYADSPIEELQADVRSVNFYRNKAKNIQNCAKMIIAQYSGKVPDSMDRLITLPGVARKTANIVLSNAYGIHEGIAVDTHVKRLAARLGLSKHSDPVKIEQDLMALTPQKEWNNVSHLLIFHGRKTCQARKPLHEKCVLFDICPSNRV